MTAVYKRELRSYINGMTGAIFAGFVLLLAGIYMVVYNLMGLYPYFEVILPNVAFIYMFAVPVLTMRSIAEEKHSRTDQLLYSLPMSVSSIVLAKYLAMVTVLAVPCAVMCLYPLILASFGTVYFTTAYASLLAFFLLGSALIAIGMFISSLTESQVIAAVVSLAVMVFINLMSGLANLIPATSGASLAGFIAIAVIIGMIVQVMIKSAVISVSVSVVLTAGCVLVYLGNPALFEGAIPSLLSSMALFDRMGAFQSGMFDMTAIIFYLSVIALFVYLTVQSMEKKRWN
ncbi:MAG: ABC transporter permease [Clostridia bacterium]|nr:ABC transporter permease [Clostridia bacterium]